MKCIMNERIKICENRTINLIFFDFRLHKRVGSSTRKHLAMFSYYKYSSIMQSVILCMITSLVSSSLSHDITFFSFLSFFDRLTSLFLIFYQKKNSHFNKLSPYNKWNVNILGSTNITREWNELNAYTSTRDFTPNLTFELEYNSGVRRDTLIRLSFE